MEQLSSLSGLGADDYALLARTHVFCHDYESATAAIDEGLRFFPENVKLISQKAFLLREAGEPEKAAEIYGKLLASGEGRQKKYLYENAITYLDFGEYEDAEGLLRRLIRQSDDEEVKGRAYQTLYWVYWVRRNFSSAEDIAFEFINSVEDTELNNYIFFMMVFQIPDRSTDTEDERKPREIFQAKLKSFQERWPNNKYLRAYRVPKEQPTEKWAPEFLAHLASLTFPIRNIRAGVEMKARAEPVSLFAIGRVFNGSLSRIWWQITHGLHQVKRFWILHDSRKLPVETENVRETREIVLEFSALLTLWELRLLEDISRYFSRIFIARSTDTLIRSETVGFDATSIAQEILDWRLRHKSKIRVIAGNYTVSGLARLAGDESAEELVEGPEDEDMKTSAFVESIDLCVRYSVPLFSDDWAVRELAQSLKGKTFSTLSLLDYWRKQELLSGKQYAFFWAELTKLNYWFVPINALTLFDCPEPIHPETLEAHEPFSTLVHNYFEMQTNPASFERVFRLWWKMLLDTGKLRVYHLVFVLRLMAIKTIKNDNFQIAKDLTIRLQVKDRMDEIEVVLALFLFQIFETVRDKWNEALRIVSEAIGKLSEMNLGRRTLDEDRVICLVLPRIAVKILSKRKDLSENKKAEFTFELTGSLPEHYRKKAAASVIKIKPDYIN